MAFYAPGPDRIQLPPFEAFRSPEAYYATALHELTHWTRHESRLQRDFGRKRFGDEGYAREELVAELGAAFLCADLGIEGEAREDHAAYLGSWLKVLKEDKRAIFQAAAHAQRAADFLNGQQERPAACAGLFQKMRRKRIVCCIFLPCDFIIDGVHTFIADGLMKCSNDARVTQHRSLSRQTHPTPSLPLPPPSNRQRRRSPHRRSFRDR
jgi:hypothetical protein